MKKAVQQMMLGSICTSEEKCKDVLNQIRNAGYEGIELNRYMIHPTSLFVRALTKAAGMPSGNTGRYDWKKLLEEADLGPVALHSDLDTLEKKYAELVKDARHYEVKDIVITGMYGYPYQKNEKVKELAKRLNAAGQRLAADGFHLLYHNHNVELVQVNEDQNAYDVLINETDPEYVNFELDTFWMADAGMDPLKMMKKLGPRMKLWHVTDRGIRVKKTPITPIAKSDSMELGTGNLDLESLFAHAKETGIPYCILESHRNWINGSPLDSVLLSSEYLKNR